jgi:hypothetical protein
MTVTLAAPLPQTDDVFKELLELPLTRQIMIKALCLVKKQFETNRSNRDDDYLVELEFEIWKLYRSIPADERNRAWEYHKA